MPFCSSDGLSFTPYDYFGAGSNASCSCRRIATLHTDRRLREVTSSRNAFSPAATGTAQKRHPAEKLLPLPWTNSASSQAQPSGLAIALKAFCKKEAAWPEGTHYRTTALPQQHAIKVRLAAARPLVVKAVDAHIRLRNLCCPIVERIRQIRRNNN